MWLGMVAKITSLDANLKKKDCIIGVATLVVRRWFAFEV